MATATSNVELVVVEIVPAAPDPDDPEQQQARDVTLPGSDDSSEEDPAAPMDSLIKKQLSTSQQQARDFTLPVPYFRSPDPEVLSWLQPLRARISQLLGVAADDYGRRCLAFLETELSIIAACLTTEWNPQHPIPMMLVDNVVHSVCRVLGKAFERSFLDEVDPSHHNHTLLRRASQFFRRRKSYSHWLLFDTARLYYFIEHISRHQHRLLSASSDLGITTPQLTEADALPVALRLEAGALCLVGMDRPAKKIFRWLARQGTVDMNTRVMSIVGPMGIGKTTLAMELRNRLRLYQTSGGRFHFQCIVMAQMPRGTDRKIGLLQDILSQVSEPAAKTSISEQSQAKLKTIEVLVRLVSEHLHAKRYFVIIDDIWDPSDWETIKGAFPSNNLDSRILITTRSTSIAWECCADSYDGLLHEIKPLCQVDSERLLLAKVVGSMDGCLPNNMKLHCDEILMRCDGIPLFIIGMADRLNKQRLQQLHQREDEDEEHQIFAMHLDQVPRQPERLEQALSSAFNDFTYAELLLFMSMFPSGYKCEKDRLLWKWIHEGIIASDRSYETHKYAESEAKAELFFSDLVVRNVITCVASNCKHKQGEVDACQWHVNHFLQQFLASKSAEMGFLFTTANLDLLMAASPATGHGNETRSRMPRRLALHQPDPRLPSLLGTMDLSQTRSLAVSGAVSGIPLEKFFNLVVLDLEGWENFKDEVLLQVCRSKMIFLCSLNVRNTRVSKLPHEIQELRSLRTLDLSYTQITELPHEIKELRKLNALDISYTQISELPPELFQLRYLEYLDLRGTQISQLPKQIVGLWDLKRLLIGGEGTIKSVEITRLPQDVEYLYTIDLTKHPASFVRALGALQKLRVIAITWSFHQSTDRDCCEALLSCIDNWQRLKSLTIHCGLGCSMEFLGSLEKSRAPPGLEKFKVTAGRFASVPSWIHGHSGLSFVQITVCNKQATDDLKILGALPELRCLILGLDVIPGQPIVIGNEGFTKLQRFSVDCPMPWLTFSIEAMGRLTYLQLKFCSTPASQNCVPSGISNLRRLTEVALCYNAQYINSPCVRLTVEAVTKQVAKHRNPIDLFINGIEQDDVQQDDDEVTENTIGTSSRIRAGGEDDVQVVGEDATAAVECEITEAES